jgi:glucose 1-dehydrogenase
VATMQDSDTLNQLNAAIPLGRMAKPEEIAHLVVWLASEQASYVTAATFTVDGGMMQFSPGL